MSAASVSPEGKATSPASGDPGAQSGGWSDRALGLVGVVLAVVYTVKARTFDGTAFSSGPVGPKTLPTGVGFLFGMVSLYLIIRPDQNPRWPTQRAWWQIGLVVGCSYIYGQILERVGFIGASAAMICVIGLLFGAPLRRLLPLSVIFPAVLAFVFNNWLKLSLPAGWWGGF